METNKSVEVLILERDTALAEVASLQAGAREMERIIVALRAICDTGIIATLRRELGIGLGDSLIGEIRRLRGAMSEVAQHAPVIADMERNHNATLLALLRLTATFPWLATVAAANYAEDVARRELAAAYRTQDEARHAWRPVPADLTAEIRAADAADCVVLIAFDGRVGSDPMKRRVIEAGYFVECWDQRPGVQSKAFACCWHQKWPVPPTTEPIHQSPASDLAGLPQREAPPCVTCGKPTWAGDDCDRGECCDCRTKSFVAETRRSADPTSIAATENPFAIIIAAVKAGEPFTIIVGAKAVERAQRLFAPDPQPAPTPPAISQPTINLSRIDTAGDAPGGDV